MPLPASVLTILRKSIAQISRSGKGHFAVALIVKDGHMPELLNLKEGDVALLVSPDPISQAILQRHYPSAHWASACTGDISMDGQAFTLQIGSNSLMKDGERLKKLVHNFINSNAGKLPYGVNKLKTAKIKKAGPDASLSSASEPLAAAEQESSDEDALLAEAEEDELEVPTAPAVTPEALAGVTLRHVEPKDDNNDYKQRVAAERRRAAEKRSAVEKLRQELRGYQNTQRDLQRQLSQEQRNLARACSAADVQQRRVEGLSESSPSRPAQQRRLDELNDKIQATTEKIPLLEQQIAAMDPQIEDVTTRLRALEDTVDTAPPTRVTAQELDAYRQRRLAAEAHRVEQHARRSDAWRHDVSDHIGRGTYQLPAAVSGPHGGMGQITLLEKTDPTAPELVMKTALSGDLNELLREKIVYDLVGDHPNIAQCMGIQTIDGTQGLVMERITGGNVDDLTAELQALRKSGKISEKEYLGSLQHIFRGAIKGLAHMEAKGLTHLDMKGLNIMIDETTDEPKLIDMGLSRKSGLDIKGGTPGYFAPDLVASGKSDTFSLGAMFFKQIEGEGFSYGGRYDRSRRAQAIPAARAYGASGEDAMRKLSDAEQEQLRRSPPSTHKDAGTYAAETAYIEFMNAILNPDPTQRPTFEQLLTMPFLADAEVDETQGAALLGTVRGKVAAEKQRREEEQQRLEEERQRAAQALLAGLRANTTTSSSSDLPSVSLPPVDPMLAMMDDAPSIPPSHAPQYEEMPVSHGDGDTGPELDDTDDAMYAQMDPVPPPVQPIVQTQSSDEDVEDLYASQHTPPPQARTIVQTQSDDDDVEDLYGSGKS